ncbi:MAG: ABC transporter permease [Christensenellales bacterium]|jgi:lipopolysaccharide transport system permease protein
MKYILKMFENFYNRRELLVELVRRDLKLKYRRSFLGYLWSTLNPLLLTVVMALVFTNMFKRNIDNFPVYLMTGNLFFSFMRDATTQSLRSITNNAALLKKVYVPKYIFTLATVTSGLVNLVLSFGALIIVMLATGVPFTWYALLSIIPLLQLYVFCVGLSLFLAQATVFFRDIQNIWSVVVTAWMYLTPVFYPLEAMPAMLQWAVPKFNPMYIYITQFRDFVLYGTMTWDELLIRGAFVAALMLAIGIWFFRRSQHKFILYI